MLISTALIILDKSFFERGHFFDSTDVGDNEKQNGGKLNVSIVSPDMPRRPITVKSVGEI